MGFILLVTHLCVVNHWTPMVIMITMASNKLPISSGFHWSDVETFFFYIHQYATDQTHPLTVTGFLLYCSQIISLRIFSNYYLRVISWYVSQKAVIIMKNEREVYTVIYQPEIFHWYIRHTCVSKCDQNIFIFRRKKATSIPV